MGKAKHVGKNLDKAFNTPNGEQRTTDIEPVAAPIMINANDGEPPSQKLNEGQDEPKQYVTNSALESIYERRNQDLAKEIGEVVEEPPAEPTPEAAEGDAGQAPSDAVTEVENPSASDTEVPAQSPATEPAAASPQPQKYPVIVNGQRIEYTLEELQQQAQLGVAARQKFEEAAELRRQAELIAASRQNSQPTHQAQSVNINTTEQLQDIPKEELLDIAKRMNYGSEEEQVEAVRKAILLGQKQGRNVPTPEQMIQAATQNALATLTAQQEQAVLKSEFPDILPETPLLYTADFVANQLAQKYVALGQPKSRLEILREAGNYVRERYLKPAASTQPEPKTSAVVTTNPNKIERKRTAPQTPTAASAVARSSSDGNTNLPVDQVIQASRKNAMSELLKARGQAVT